VTSGKWLVATERQFFAHCATGLAQVTPAICGPSGDVSKLTPFDTSPGVILGGTLVDELSFWQHALMKYARY
jgi:hypothetical protein